MKIGIFDSGVGGEAVAEAARKALPQHNIICVNDKQHLPYGTKSPKEIQGYVVPILEKLVADGCEIMVIACNTVTTTLIGQLREIIKVPLVAVEPMVKPAAALTKSGVIVVCATPTTLKSSGYKRLKDTFARDIKVIEPDCSDWTSLIETNDIHQEHIQKPIDAACEQGADVIVLGCTHYHWIEDLVTRAVAGRAIVLQPEQAIINRLKQEIERLG